MAPEHDVVLYGATGYTGRLIAHALDAAGASYAVAGRDRAKLEALAAMLPGKPAVEVAALSDAAALEAMASRARVVCSAAGPFVEAGPPVLQAAIAAGTAFCDITGEQAYLHWAATQDAAARDAGVAVVNAVGFDVVPSDFAAVRAAAGATDVARLDIGIAVRGSGLSRGTRRSMAASAGAGGWTRDGRLRSAPPGRFVRGFDFPPPLGRRQGVFIPWGDCVTAPRSTRAREVRTFFVVPRQRARAMHLAWPATALAARLPPLRRRMAERAQRAPEGPSPQARAQSAFTILAEATRADGRIHRAVARGRDPYGLTGACAAHAAQLLADRRVRGTGVLTPGQAFQIEDFVAAIDPSFGFSLQAGV